MKTISTLFLFVMTSFAMAQSTSKARNQFDSYFPAKGRFNAGILTTYGGINPPPIVIGEVTYGISKRTALGIVGGTTGAQGLYALKLNTVIRDRSNFRVNFRMISIYYPGRDGRFLFDRADKHIIPWMASMGTVETEWRTEKNVRWSLGVGGLETHCMVRLQRWLHSLQGDEDQVMPIDLFATLNASVSIPLSRKLTLRPECFAVFNKSGLIQRREFMVSSPINPYLNLVYSF